MTNGCPAKVLHPGEENQEPDVDPTKSHQRDEEDSHGWDNHLLPEHSIPLGRSPRMEDRSTGLKNSQQELGTEIAVKARIDENRYFKELMAQDSAETDYKQDGDEGRVGGEESSEEVEASTDGMVLNTKVDLSLINKEIMNKGESPRKDSIKKGLPIYQQLHDDLYKETVTQATASMLEKTSKNEANNQPQWRAITHMGEPIVPEKYRWILRDWHTKSTNASAAPESELGSLCYCRCGVFPYYLVLGNS
jgi:hypothetical protein